MFWPGIYDVRQVGDPQAGRLASTVHLHLDLKLGGNKKNYDLIFALAPEDIIPVLERYENRGEIFFETTINGKSIHGNRPAVEASFGCKNGFFKNREKRFFKTY